ncbi:MAG: polysaccharide biosynthesis C-terminal domain-containing protein [Bacteroidales bacterium]|nr:polysaccharide biosynthesis C-terminal domain-containing protein [Bacteroidales bacterium]
MKSPIKSLLSQTAAYGLSSIIGRLIGYFLVPLYTRLFLTNEFGVYTELQAYVAFLLVILTYGMETGFFRFSENSDTNKNSVYSTILTAVFFTSLGFAFLIYSFSFQIADLIGYSKNPEYVLLLGLTVAIDSFSSIPFASLRLKRKAWKFVTIKLVNISVNVILNIFFLIILPKYFSSDNFFYRNIYNGIDVGYIFISYFITSIITLFLLIPEMSTAFKVFKFDFPLLKQILKYSIPLLFAGLAGMISENLDKVLIKYLLTIPAHIIDAPAYVMSELGIYGANVKIAVLMTLFIQAFRYAAEPFFFSYAKNADAKVMYAKVMKFFIIFGLSVFLGITLLIDFVKYIIDPSYHEGLKIVPVLLFGKIFFGIVFNLSIWYKLTNKTKYAVILAFVGAIVTIILNIILVPIFGYLGAAWAAFFAYFAMMLLSYYYGNKHYYIEYDLKNIFIYLIIALLIYFLNLLLRYLIDYYIILNILLLFSFFVFVLKKENFRLDTLKRNK